MSKVIMFDMDGPVYDLYGVDNWLEKLENSDVSAYADGAPLVNLRELEKVCKALIAKGFEIGVITWLSKNGSERFNRNTTLTKKMWIENNMPYVTKFTAQKYGTPKQKALDKSVKFAILVDDNKDVREMWNTPKQRKSIDANNDIISELWKLIK
jgi:hypothetical protein